VLINGAAQIIDISTLAIRTFCIITSEAFTAKFKGRAPGKISEAANHSLREKDHSFGDLAEK